MAATIKQCRWVGVCAGVTRAVDYNGAARASEDQTRATPQATRWGGEWNPVSRNGADHGSDAYGKAKTSSSAEKWATDGTVRRNVWNSDALSGSSKKRSCIQGRNRLRSGRPTRDKHFGLPF
jgi:hypothetical protein